MTLYCGNNSSDPELINGVRELGTRHGCMKVGFGIGYNKPVNPKFADDVLYTPIDTTKFYCGNKNERPNEYDRIGSISECLRKGVGIGMKKRASDEFFDPVNDNDDIFMDANAFSPEFVSKQGGFGLLILFGIISIFIFLYFWKPEIIMKVNSIESEKVIDWSKFTYCFFTLTLIFIFFLYIVKLIV